MHRDDAHTRVLSYAPVATITSFKGRTDTLGTLPHPPLDSSRPRQCQCVRPPSAQHEVQTNSMRYMRHVARLIIMVNHVDHVQHVDESTWPRGRAPRPARRSQPATCIHARAPRLRGERECAFNIRFRI